MLRYNHFMSIKDSIRDVLEKGYLISLGTVDDGGVWVSEVIYVNDDDLNIYWISDPNVRHSKAIVTNKKVAGTITVSNESKTPGLGIQIEGNAEKIEGARVDLLVKHFMKRGKIAPEKVADFLDGDSWYVLKPTKIQLIDEKNFGFKKQDFTL